MKRLATLTAALLVGSIGLSIALAERSTATPAPPPTPIQIIDGNLAPALYWYQQAGNSCEPSALNFIIGAVKGARLKASTINAEAAKTTDFTVGGGMSWQKGVNILAHYGIKSTIGTHSLAYLEEALRTGHRVAALVDANKIWAPLGWVATTDGSIGWHTVVVDEINVTGGTVTLTDSGPTIGQVETIPLADFLAGWAPGNYQIIVTS